MHEIAGVIILIKFVISSRNRRLLNNTKNFIVKSNNIVMHEEALN